MPIKMRWRKIIHLTLETRDLFMYVQSLWASEEWTERKKKARIWRHFGTFAFLDVRQSEEEDYSLSWVELI